MNNVINHTATFEVQQTWGRCNHLARLFYEIAAASYDDFLAAKESIQPTPEGCDPTEEMRWEDRKVSASIKTIVFAAMACEAAIFDLAAIQLGDEYAKSLDKLDALGKWAVVPALVCGSRLAPNGPAFNGLRTLIPTRNLLVHHKSSPWVPNEAAIKKADGAMEKIINCTPAAFQTVVLLSLELNELLGTPAGVLPMFEKDDALFVGREESPRIAKAIQRCREIHERSRARDCSAGDGG